MYVYTKMERRKSESGIEKKNGITFFWYSKASSIFRKKEKRFKSNWSSDILHFLPGQNIFSSAQMHHISCIPFIESVGWKRMAPRLASNCWSFQCKETRKYLRFHKIVIDVWTRAPPGGNIWQLRKKHRLKKAGDKHRCTGDRRCGERSAGWWWVDMIVTNKKQAESILCSLFPC